MITVLLILFIFIFFVIKIRSFEKYDLDKIPGPPGLPFIGNVFDLLADRGECNTISLLLVIELNNILKYYYYCQKVIFKKLSFFIFYVRRR